MKLLKMTLIFSILSSEYTINKEKQDTPTATRQKFQAFQLSSKTILNLTNSIT